MPISLAACGLLIVVSITIIRRQTGFHDDGGFLNHWRCLLHYDGFRFLWH
jgi:hypothetical protein